MDKNKFRYCTLLLIDDYNHSKIFISEKNKYYIKDDNESINIKILNEFEDIRKSCKINVKNTTDNYYKNVEPFFIRHCTILLIDHDNHSKIFISENNCTILVVLVINIMIMIIMMMMMIIMMILFLIIMIN